MHVYVHVPVNVYVHICEGSCVCVDVYVHVCGDLYACVHMYVYMCIWRSHVNDLRCHSLWFLRHGPLLIMTSLSRMVWLANEPQGFSCFSLCRAGRVSAHHHTWLFVWPGVKLGSTHLQGKCFIASCPLLLILHLKKLFYFNLGMHVYAIAPMH